MESVKRFAVPNGSLMAHTLEILASIGFILPPVGRNDFYGKIGGIEFYRRDRETIPGLVAAGKFDAGITGSDLRVNAGIGDSDVRVVGALRYARASNSVTRWVLAAKSEISNFAGLRIGTERIGLARHCLSAELAQGATLVKLSGTEESAVSDELCDLVFVVTESGGSLRAHGLKIIRDNLFVSTPEVLCYLNAPIEAQQVAKEIYLAMQAILAAEFMVTVKFDLRLDDLAGLQLPSAVSPTISDTQDPAWVAAEVLIERRQFGHVLRLLANVGAQGIYMQDVQGYIKGGAIE